MAKAKLDAIFFIKNAPVIEFHDGLFHVCYSIGKRAKFEVVMSPKVFIQTRLMGNDAIAQWQLESAPGSNVTNIKRDKS